MTEKTVTVNGTEVTVRETDDGFEAEEVKEGMYLRGVSSGGDYGFEVPGEANIQVRYNGSKYDPDPIEVQWDAEDDVSDLDSWHADDAFERGAYVASIETVEY